MLVRLVGSCHSHLFIVPPETIAKVKTSWNNAIYDWRHLRWSATETDLVNTVTWHLRSFGCQPASDWRCFRGCAISSSLGGVILQNFVMGHMTWPRPWLGCDQVMWPITKFWGSNHITRTAEPKVVKFCTHVGYIIILGTGWHISPTKLRGYGHVTV